MITGVAAVLAADLSWRQTSVPGRSGNMRSSTTRSGCVSRTRAKACAASPAVMVSKPACLSANSSTWTMSFSSSTMRMRWRTSRVIPVVCDGTVTRAQLSVQRARLCERERGDVGVELAAVLGDHPVGALHRAVRCLEDRAAGVLELFAGSQDRLVADHAVALDLLALAVAVGDDPVAAAQLVRDRADVLDAQRVGEGSSGRRR